MDLPAGLLTRLSEREEKLLAVEVVLEDGFAMIAAIHHMVDRSGIFEAQLTGHGFGLPPLPSCVNVEDPFSGNLRTIAFAV